MIAFLDACAVIYRVESVEPYLGKLKRALNRIEKESPAAVVAVSRLSLLECRIKPLRERDESALRLYQDFFTSPGLQIVELDSEVMERATLIRVEARVSTPDALQAASALSLGGEIRFFTNDPEFKRISGLRVELL